MKILKKGRQENKNTKTFTCQKCGCEFTAEEDEYAERYNIALTTQKEFVCSCPECHKIVLLSKVNDFGYSWITLDDGVQRETISTNVTPAVYDMSNRYAPSCTTVSTSGAVDVTDVTLSSHVPKTATVTNIDVAKAASSSESNTSIAATKSEKVKNEKA